MKEYSNQKYKFYKTTIHFGEDDTICYIKQTPLSYTHEIIPLVQFAPEAQVMQKKLSSKAKWLIRLEVFLLGLFYFFYFSNSEFAAIVNLPAAIGLTAFFGLGTLLYGFLETRKYVYFCDFNFQKVLMVLPYDKDDLKQHFLIKHFDIAVRNARVNIDQRNMNKLQRGIDTLHKQQIISQNFADLLRARISNLTGTII